jgi:hypothetical protein
MSIIPDAWKPRLTEVWSKMRKPILFVYLVGVSCLATYLTATLWMAEVKEPPAPATNSPNCTDKAGDPPKITVLDPDSVAIGENHLNVAVWGCNLTPNPKVRFNGIERQSGPGGDHELIVSLQASDFAGAANIAVSVETHELDAKGAPQNTLLSNVLNLKVKQASDLKAVWMVWGGKHEITLELRLILLVLFTGTLAASVSGMKSLVDYIGTKKFDDSWLAFYFAQPLVGSGLAFIFYLVTRAGFLAGTSADIKAVNPFGFVAVAALVGMFSDSSFRKLNEIFDTLFKVAAKDTRSGKLAGLSIDAPSSLPPATNATLYTFKFQAKDGGPPYTWTAVTNPLPGGLTLSPQGVLSGTPPAAVAETAFTIQVKDAAGEIATAEFRLTIN